jgi:hypothetical protein
VGLRRFCRMDDIACFVSRSWELAWPVTLVMFFEFLISPTDVYVAGRISKEVQAVYGWLEFLSLRLCRVSRIWRLLRVVGHEHLPIRPSPLLATRFLRKEWLSGASGR